MRHGMPKVEVDLPGDPADTPPLGLLGVPNGWLMRESSLSIVDL
jgi:hypothetical protein